MSLRSGNRRLMGQELDPHPGYQDDHCDDDRYDESPVGTFFRRDRINNFRARGMLNLEVAGLELTGDVGCSDTLLRINLQTLPRNFTEGLRNGLGHDDLSLIAIRVLQFRFVLGEDGDQGELEKSAQAERLQEELFRSVERRADCLCSG